MCYFLFVHLLFFVFFFFFFNDTATTEIYTLSLHDALPISICKCCWRSRETPMKTSFFRPGLRGRKNEDRKSTRLNSSHSQISYAVFCLKKKKKKKKKRNKQTKKHTKNRDDGNSKNRNQK